MSSEEEFQISKIIGVVPNDDYTLTIEFEQGSKVLFNMQKMIRTIPYNALSDLEHFRNVVVEEKALYWPDKLDPGMTLMPIRLTVDSILFAIRD